MPDLRIEYGRYGRSDCPDFKPAIPTSPESEIHSPTSSNSGQKFDQGKLRYDLIPPEPLEAMASVLTHGAEKYAPDNWKQVPHAVERYQSAMWRHFQAWRKGETLDPDSGLPHLHHALCNLAFLVWFEEHPAPESPETTSKENTHHD